VVRIVTPGTALDDTMLDSTANNYLMAAHEAGGVYAFAFVDLSTGEFRVGQAESRKIFEDIVFKIGPSEIIVTRGQNDDFLQLLEEYSTVNFYELPEYTNEHEILCTHFGVKDLHGYGIEGEAMQVMVAGRLLSYAEEAQRQSLGHINTLHGYTINEFMVLDETTIRNLDLIFNSFDGGKEGSLLSIIDKTRTSMGGRLLRKWLLHPLKEIDELEQRYDAVEYFVNHYKERENLVFALRHITDYERLLARIACGRATPRDIVHLSEGLRQIPAMQEILATIDAPFAQFFVDKLDSCEDLVTLIGASLHEDASVSLSDGGFIADGYDEELDELRKIAFAGKDYIKDLQVRERERTDIATLKVKFNKVFGYYIEVPRAQSDNVPEDYIRKQTLVNAERFIIPELKEYEEKVLTAEDKIKQLEQGFFYDIIEKIKPFFERVQNNAHYVAQLDILVGFAVLASDMQYIRPSLNTTGNMTISQGRHPVIEQSPIVEHYIPNDAQLDNDSHQLLLLTGPNMAGKSSYLRQIALITLLAQIGCFVPAQKADISICDRIFTRVGASDNVSRGQSTFMVEMQEAANILNNATDQSLIILDEVGRGTSTYDGVSIAWGIIHYIYHKIGAKTMFATHYHELIEMVGNLDRGQNYAMAVKEQKDGVLFLHQVVKGGINKSYGIEVAKLAGVPSEVSKKAYEFLRELEEQSPASQSESQSAFIFDTKEPEVGMTEGQETVLQEIEGVDINTMTPLEAFNLIVSLKQKL
jgi:DNA mismatch repair protein MutS